MPTTNDTETEKKVLSISSGRSRKTVPVLDKIESHWNEVRAKRLVPSRCEIDPRGMEGVLGHAFILERIAGGLARFRIAGSHLSDLSGLELRQMPISALFLPNSREILGEAIEACFDQPAVVRLRIQSAASFGREQIVGEMILLPLRSDLGDVDRILGGIVLEGKIGRTPRRFDVLSQTRQSLTGYAGPHHVHAPGGTAGADFGTKNPGLKKSILIPGRRKNEVQSTLSSTPRSESPNKSTPPKAQETKVLRTSERPYLKLVVENDA